MFSVYFVFHCLNMFCIEKTGVRVFRGSAGDSPVAKPQSRVHLEALATYSWLACDSLTTRENFRESRVSHEQVASESPKLLDELATRVLRLASRQLSREKL